MSQQQSNPSRWTPAWIVVAACAAVVTLVLAVQAGTVPLEWWGFPFMAAAGAGMTFLFGLAREQLLRTHAAHTLAWLAAGGWVTWVVRDGWSDRAWLALFGGTLVLAGLLHVCRTPEADTPARPDDIDTRDRRPAPVREWESLIRRRLRGAPVTVTGVVPWPNPEDGEWVYVDLPEDGSVEPEAVVNAVRGMAIAKKLPKGCTIGVVDGEHQGALVLEVMLRDTSGDAIALDGDYSPASVYDEFEVMVAPQGDSLRVCLRQQSMVIGGAPESGKTTLLHRIILFLARCTDCLIWVVDTNGGGVAVPWLRAWAMGKAPRPVIDWVADTDEEAAVLVAVATAIAKDRKTSPEAVRRRHGADNTVLPVDEHLPAIVVLNDEGGEVRQAVSVLGQIADAGISRLAQIGRAEAVRAIKSVLRGTSDLLDKGMRVCANIRICLRMTETGEYGHVLDAEPPKGLTLNIKGDGLLRRGGIDARPMRGRTVNVLLSQIEEASIACAQLRPDLDERGQRVAARLRPLDVLGGRDPAAYPDLAKLRVMQDVAAGRAYTGRWERFANRLAAIRGEELPEPDDIDDVAQPTPAGPVAPPPVSPGVAREGTALAQLLAVTGVIAQPSQQSAAPAAPAVDLADQESVDREAARLLAAWRDTGGEQATEPDCRPGGKLTTRDHIVEILRGSAEPLTSAQIGMRLERRDAAVARTYRQDVLARMRQAGEVAQGPDGRYRLPEARS